MVIIPKLRSITEADHIVVKEVYEDAIESQAGSFYTKEQIEAWASLAYLPGILDQTLQDGIGWLVIDKDEIEAFAVRYPLNRLALLYCRGRSARRGFATALLKKIEEQALDEDQSSLITEASLLSYPLLLRHSWNHILTERIEIAGISFKRYKMEKYLTKGL